MRPFPKSLMRQILFLIAGLGISVPIYFNSSSISLLILLTFLSAVIFAVSAEISFRYMGLEDRENYYSVTKPLFIGGLAVASFALLSIGIESNTVSSVGNPAGGPYTNTITDSCVIKTSHDNVPWYFNSGCNCEAEVRAICKSDKDFLYSPEMICDEREVETYRGPDGSLDCGKY